MKCIYHCGRRLAAGVLLLGLLATGVVPFAGCLSFCGTSREGVVYVDTFNLGTSSCGYGKHVQAKASVDGHALTLGKKTYARGFGTHPESAIAFTANGKVTTFEAIVGIDADGKQQQKQSGVSAAIFRVRADGKIVWQSGVLTDRMQPVPVCVDITGAHEIILETAGGNAWKDFPGANADWADARFTCAKGATLDIVDDAEAFAQWGILTPREKEEPQFNGADIYGVRPGHPIIFRIPISGIRPMTYVAKGLPAGVRLDDKGVLRGTAPSTCGAYDIVVTATNTKGSASRTIRLQVGETIALTPPMGWNSWNVWCYRLTQEHAMASARALEESGLGDHGWAYINLDDWWAMNNSGCKRIEMRKNDFGGREDVIGPARDAQGKILPNRSFPDMKKFTDYVHGFGFKAGLYSSPGALTCGLCEGSLGHEAQDAASWADWGFDYVKYDWCSYAKVFAKETNGKDGHNGKYWKDLTLRESYVKPYRIMGTHLKQQKRDIVYSLCQYGMSETQDWVRKVNGNCWRSWDDLKDGWTWLEQAIESHIEGTWDKVSGPGCWADPDMMIVGRQYSFGFDHPTFLTPNEQYTHVSLWAMFCSPLLIGCDVTKLDAFTRSLLLNDEVIAISQDRLGKPARRVRKTDADSVWVRPLANGDVALALMSRHPIAREIRVSLKDLGLAGGWRVRDCWVQCDEGRIDEEVVAIVPAHATKLMRLSPVSCSKCF